MSEIQKVENTALVVSEDANKLIIKDDTTYVQASDKQAVIKLLKKKVEETFGEIKKKSYEAYKVAQKHYKAVLDPLDDADKSLSQKMIEYKKSLEQADDEFSELPEVKGQTFRTNWRYRIVDISKIPAEYLIPDEKRIGEVVRGLKDMTNIPGIEVYKEESVSRRAS